MEPWLIALLIAVAVVVVITALTLYWLRRRRAGTVLTVPPGQRAGP